MIRWDRLWWIGVWLLLLMPFSAMAQETVDRRVHHAWNNCINVREALPNNAGGAAGDGKADDTRAIQTAVEYANSHRYAAAHACILFPAGKYLVTHSINMCAVTGNERATCRFPEGIDVWGAGQWSSVIEPRFAANASPAGPVLDFGGATFSHMRRVGMIDLPGDHATAGVISSHGGENGVIGDSFGMDHVNVDMQNAASPAVAALICSTDTSWIDSSGFRSKGIPALIVGDGLGSAHGIVRSPFYRLDDGRGICVGNNNFTHFTFGQNSGATNIGPGPASQWTGSSEWDMSGNNYFTADGDDANNGVIEISSPKGESNIFGINGLRTEYHGPSHPSGPVCGLWFDNGSRSFGGSITGELTADITNPRSAGICGDGPGAVILGMNLYILTEYNLFYNIALNDSTVHSIDQHLGTFSSQGYGTANDEIDYMGSLADAESALASAPVSNSTVCSPRMPSCIRTGKAGGRVAGYGGAWEIYPSSMSPARGEAFGGSPVEWDILYNLGQGVATAKVISGFSDYWHASHAALLNYDIAGEIAGDLPLNIDLLHDHAPRGSQITFGTSHEVIPATAEICQNNGTGCPVLSAMLKGTTGVIGGFALAANHCVLGRAVVAGARPGQHVYGITPAIDPNGAATQDYDWYGQVSAPNTVAIKICARGGGTPVATTYSFLVY